MALMHRKGLLPAIGCMARSALWLSCFSLVWSCAGSPALRAAKNGDRAALRYALAQERAAGRLDPERVLELAEIVGLQEIARASGDEGIARIEDAKACGLKLRSGFEARARNEDAVAAVATLALLEGGPRAAEVIDRDRIVTRLTSSDAHWRAVAVRTLPAGQRGKFFADPDERVRLSALRSALEHPAALERTELLEVARLDPNSLARSLAVRALGGVGDSEVVLALRDLYDHADDVLRASIVEAWAAPRCSNQGGTREIARIAQSERGLAALAAGSALLAAGGEGRGAGLRTLIRVASEGSTAERVLAIGRLPLRAQESSPTPDSLELDYKDACKTVESAAASTDTPVRIAALKRLLELPASRDKALADMRALSNNGSRVALMALVEARDATAIEQLRRELDGGSEAETRLAIARALLAAGGKTQVAELLADADAHVRTSVACALLLGP